MSNRAIQVFLDVDLRMGHKGLAALAKKEGIRVERLQPGEFVFFLNSQKNRVKLYTAYNVVSYLKLSHGKISMRTLSQIPQAFQASGKIMFNAGQKELVEYVLKKKTPHALELRAA